MYLRILFLVTVLMISSNSASACVLYNVLESDFSHAPYFVIAGPDDYLDDVVNEYFRVYILASEGCAWSALYINKLLVGITIVIIGLSVVLYRKHRRKKFD